MEQVLEGLSYTQKQIDFIFITAQNGLKEALENRRKLLESKRKALASISHKIDKMEQRLIDEEIEPVTYQKWFRKLSGQKRSLQFEIENLNDNNKKAWQRLEKVLPFLLSIKNLYRELNLGGKQRLLKEVFKAGLIFDGTCYRTPFLHPAISHNYLKIKEKGFLIVEQSYENLGVSPICTRDGS